MIDDLLRFDKCRQAGRTAMDVQEYKATNESEDHLQKQCEEWLEWMHIPYIRIPEAITKLVSPTHPVKIPIWIKKAISHYFLGLPDLIILAPNKSGKYNRCLCVELKTAKGKTSQGQKNFAKYVNVQIERSFEAFEKLVNDFLKGEKP